MKKLIITGDDFGRSQAVNEAIEEQHQAGFLTQASLMVNEPAAAEAVRIARRNPKLCVGLHLTLCNGRAATVSRIAPRGRFPHSPASAGLRAFFFPQVRRVLRKEIATQFAAFRAFGLPATYWDGHAHLHLHPTILRATLPVAHARAFTGTRLVREPGAPALLPLVFHALSRAARPHLLAHRIGFADRVFGLRDTGAMNAETLSGWLRRVSKGVTEIYLHPGAEPGRCELPALLEIVRTRKLQLTTLPAVVAARVR